LRAASVGLQVGIRLRSSRQMTDTGPQRLLASSFQMGGDVAIAAGPSIAAREPPWSPISCRSVAHRACIRHRSDRTVVRGRWNDLTMERRSSPLTSGARRSATGTRTNCFVCWPGPRSSGSIGCAPDDTPGSGRSGGPRNSMKGSRRRLQSYGGQQCAHRNGPRRGHFAIRSRRSAKPMLRPRYSAPA
jgi:hypothetical protein